MDGVVDSLSRDDIKLAKSMEGFEGIAKILLDTINSVVRFVLNDGTNLRVDMGVDDKPALKSLQKEIADGNAYYEGGALNYILQCITPHCCLKGDVIVINKLPRENMTLGEVKSYYKLPDGCLRNNVIQGGGNFDKYQAVAPIDIHVETLANGIGVTPDQIRALFQQNK